MGEEENRRPYWSGGSFGRGSSWDINKYVHVVVWKEIFTEQ